LLDPLRQRLTEFRERIDAIHTEDTQSAAALREQLAQLRELNRRMADECGALTRALKGESKTQGAWGELVLERILEKSGLQKGIEYETQAGFRAGDGARFHPDVVIRLPENRHLIIDAKVSLTAYERHVNAETEAARQAALREHVLSVRRHVEELSRRDYPSLPELQSPDFVLMFVPVEPALHLALQQDGALFGDAFERNVVLVSSSTLLVTLRAVESVWRRQKQTLNALEIARQAGNLHDQFVLFVEIGQRLDQARAAYEQAFGRLSTGRGNLVRRTLELQKLGARAEKQIPPGLAQRALEGAEEGPANGG
jgi:DNA recombination protein RmuC